MIEVVNLSIFRNFIFTVTILLVFIPLKLFMFDLKEYFFDNH